MDFSVMRLAKKDKRPRKNQITLNEVIKAYFAAQLT